MTSVLYLNIGAIFGASALYLNIGAIVKLVAAGREHRCHTWDVGVRCRLAAGAREKRRSIYSTAPVFNRSSYGMSWLKRHIPQPSGDTALAHVRMSTRMSMHMCTCMPTHMPARMSG